MSRMVTLTSLIGVLVVVLICTAAQSATYYVAPTGNDANPGNEAQPFRTVQKAADVMQPGDTVLIRGGIYREKVTPPRGGTSDNARITYRGYPGETAILTGAERITAWVSQGGGVWRVDLPDALFGNYNPYKLTFNDAAGRDWLHTHDVRPGEVFLNNQALGERKSIAAIQSTLNTWYSTGPAGTTTLYANFGGADPNTANAEITVRQQVFKPDSTSVLYITLDNLTFTKAATQWVEPGYYQDGMVSTYWGGFWIIENCVISHAKTVGIVSGHPGRGTQGFPNFSPTSGRPLDMTSYGNHIVRNNLIQYCGTNGIAGQWGWNRSIIENNIIEHTNAQANIGGIELAGIKVHYASDITIRNNIIRYNHVGPSGHGQAFGIWLDYECQGNRISSNVIYGMQNCTAAIYIEASHGPNLVDNNVVASRHNLQHASRVISAHNLFSQSGHWPGIQAGRGPWAFQPHSYTRISGSNTEINNTGFRFYNDIYINSINLVGNHPDLRQGGNVFYPQGDIGGVGANGSVTSNHNTQFSIEELANGVRIRLNVNDAPWQTTTSFITRDFIGVYQPMNMGIEDRNSTPITINHDILGNPRTRPVPGPFETLQLGWNEFTILAGPDTSAPQEPQEPEPPPPEPDTPPQILSTPPTAATVGRSYNYAITVSGNPVPILSMSGAPAWLTLSGSTLSGTPGPDDVGLTGTITLTAANGVNPNAVQSFRIAVFSVQGGTFYPYLFYRNSAFDVPGDGAGAPEDNAIALDKLPLWDGQQGTFENYSSYARGINGIIIDFFSLSDEALGPQDFNFQMGRRDELANWQPAPQPQIAMRPGQGVGGSDRVTLTWEDGTITNTWLRVQVQANSRTGLAQSVGFAFGNAIGETGNNPAQAIVDVADVQAVRSNPRGYRSPAEIVDVHDFNRDRRVDATDELIARHNMTDAQTALPLIRLNPPSGQLLVYELFLLGSGNYSVAALGGQSPAIAGMSRAWQTIFPPGFSVVSQGLNYSDGNYHPGSGGAVRATGSHARTGRLLAQPFTSSTEGVYYISFLMRLESATATGVWRAFELHNAGWDDNPHRVFSLSHNEQFRFSVGGNTYDVGLINTSVNLFVIRLDLKSAAGSDQLTVWRNPNLASGQAPAGGVTVSGLDIQFDRVTFAFFPNGAGVDFDELRIGTSFAAVTSQAPPP